MRPLQVMLWAAALLSAPVSLSFGPGPMSDLAPRLTELSGQTVRVDSRLAREVVVVEASDVDVAELRNRLAQVVCGTWSEKDGVLILSSDPEKELARRAESDARVGAMFRQARRDYANAIKAQALRWPVDEVALRWEDDEKFGREAWSPVERGVGLALAGMSDAEFGSFFRQVRFYYSDAARPGVRQWGAEARRLVADGAAQEAKLMHRLADRGIPVSDERSFFDPFNTPIAAAPKGETWTVLIGHNHNPYAPPRASHGRQLKLQAWHLDADGRILGERDITIPGVRRFDYAPAAMDFEPSKLAGSSERFLGAEPRSDAAEPLARFAGLGFRRMARDLGRDLCFCLPDSYAPRDARPLTHAQALADMAEEPMALDDEAGWLLGQPFDPTWSRTNRLDRSHLAAYVEECFSKEILPVQERLTKPGCLRTMCMDWRTNLASRVVGTKRLPHGTDVMLGQLSDKTLTALARGEALMFDRLPKVDQDAIWETARNGSAFVSWERDGGLRNLIQRREVLFGWPQGIPQDARVRLVLDRVDREKRTREGRLEVAGPGMSKLGFFVALPMPSQ